MIEEQMATEPQPTAEKTSRWEDYIDVFFSPAELYARRANDRIAPPLLTLLALAVIFYFVLLPANSMVMRASIEANPDAAAVMDRFGTVFQIVGSLFIPITYVVVIAAAAFVLMLVGRFVDLRTEFSRTMLIATYAAFVYLLAQIAGGVAVLLHGEAGLDIIRHGSFGPLRFLGDADMNPVVMALLRRFEIFTLWQTVLWGIGIAVIYRTTTSRAAIVAGLTWLLLTLPSVLMALVGFGQMGGRGG